jgi:hypothetical protein
MLRLNSPPRCRSSGTGWKLARVRCVAGSNTSLRHLFCKPVVIAHPKRQFLISSIRGEVKKKHNCIDRSFSCFPAHVNEPDRFEPSAPKTRVAQALRLNFGCPSEVKIFQLSKDIESSGPGSSLPNSTVRWFPPACRPEVFRSPRPILLRAPGIFIAIFLLVEPSNGIANSVPPSKKPCELAVPSVGCPKCSKPSPNYLFFLSSRARCGIDGAPLIRLHIYVQCVIIAHEHALVR